MSEGAKSPEFLEEAQHGIRWAAGQAPEGHSIGHRLYVGGQPLALALFPAARGTDDYAVQFRREGPRVLANSAVGTISGILKLGEVLRAGRRKNVSAHLRFCTRNYKHELGLSAQHPHWVGHYSDEMWEALCQRLVSHQFNGLVFYGRKPTCYHPFEFLLDYREWPQAASQTNADRAATRSALQRGLEIAHRYGLKTFLQHYVGHFTKPLAEVEGIPNAGRHSGTTHPVVMEYCRYCYREVFRQLPDLDGLYFNFESYGNAHEHVLATAIPELNAMERRPIVVFRLWGYTDYSGMARMLRAYRGRVILGHKIMDTNDAYYLPVADSRVMEWKKRLGGQIEWMFLVGPCHNCATNLCEQLWADYDFVQELLADAEAKGADSISFHSKLELFSADLPDPKGIFTDHEETLSRFNRLHVLAASDYANGVTRTPSERGRTMAELNGVTPAAGRRLVEAIRSSSQLILLIYQQFYMSSDRDGYLNRGWYSTIQEPFYFHPVSELNHQSRKLLFQPGWNHAWVTKTIDTTIVKDGTYQYILDAVDPSRTGQRARLNPLVVARLLQRNANQSRRELAAYRRAAGAEAAATLAPYIERNAVTGDYVRHEILAALQLYGLYFPKSRAAVTRAIQRGLAELKAAAALISDRQGAAYKQLVRSVMLNIQPEIEIRLAEELLQWWTDTPVPMRAFAAYAESHRRFNEIRRVVRPGRQLAPAHLRHARRCLGEALRAVGEALAALEGVSDGDRFQKNIQRWRDYLAAIRGESHAPHAFCDARHDTPLLPLHHEDCFRTGEDFLEDFVSFFRPVDFARQARLSMQVSRTRTDLVVRLHEDGIGLDGRRSRWQEYHGEGSDAHVLHVCVDTENRGRTGDIYTVWPVGGGVSCGPRLNLPAIMVQKDHGNSWDMTVRLPFKVLGRTPREGETWGFNVSSNPFVTRNTCYTWASQYESANPRLYGKLTFG